MPTDTLANDHRIFWRKTLCWLMYWLPITGCGGRIDTDEISVYWKCNRCGKVTR